MRAPEAGQWQPFHACRGPGPVLAICHRRGLDDPVVRPWGMARDSERINEDSARKIPWHSTFEHMLAGWSSRMARAAPIPLGP